MKAAAQRWLALGGLVGAIFVAGALATGDAHGAVLQAADFGALPDDGRDDTDALRKLLAAAVREPGSTARLAPGRYEVSTGTDGATRQPIFAVADAVGLTLDGAGATIAVTGIAPLFDFRRVQGVRVEGLTVDWAVRPAAGVEVVEVGSEQVRFRWATTGPVVSGLPVQSLYLYDGSAQRPAAARKNRYWIEGAKPPPLQVKSDGTFSAPLRGYDSPLAELALQPGDQAVLRFAIYGCNAFTFTACAQVAISGVTLLASPGMGIVGVDTSDILLERVAVRPAPGQWISTCADATHFVACRGTVTLRDCWFEGMGDDALNLRSDLFRVQAVDTTGIVLERGKNPQAAVSPVPRPGDELAFSPPREPLAFELGGIVKQARRAAGQPRLEVELAQGLPPGLEVGSTVVNWTATAALVVERLTVRHNHGRGLLIQTPRPVRVLDGRFERQSGSAIQITSDVRQWWEGPPVRDVRIERCVFAGGNDGAARHGAVLSIYADEANGEASAPVHQGITIAHCVFEDYGDTAIRVSSARTVHIEGNTFQGAGHPIAEWHARGVELLDNRLAPPSP